MATLADRAVELGLASTDWFDVSQGHPGIERRSTINPRANDWQSRYGTNGSMIEYNPRNWAGAHAPMGNVDAPIVYLEVFRQLGKPIEKTSNDLSDLDLIDGLTRYVMDQAARLRITANSVLNQSGDNTQPSFPPPAPPVTPIDPNPQPINPTPPIDPCASVKADLAAANQKVALVQRSLTVATKETEAANALLNDIEDIVTSLKFPAGNTGGIAWVSLRKIRKLLAR